MVQLSIIIPTFNAERYIKEAIDSILSQTFQDFEILIIDDGSDDRTLDILKGYNNQRIKILYGPKKGISAALNLGIDSAKGEYIARMDADDISLPSRFEKQIKFMSKNTDIDICGTSALRFTENGNSYVWSKPENDIDIKTMLLIDVPMIHPTIMFRKSTLDKYNLKYSEKYNASEDFDMWVRASKFAKFYNIQEVLLKYREHSNNASITNEDKGKKYFLEIVKNNLFEKFGYEISDSLIEGFWLACNDNAKFTLSDLIKLTELFNKFITDVQSNQEYTSDYPLFKKLLFNRINYLTKIATSNIVQQNYHTKDKNILIVSHDLSQTGAPLILIPVVDILLKNGFKVTLLAYSGGPLLKTFEDKGIPVIISPGSFIDESLFKNIASPFGIVWANTIVSYPVLKFLSTQNNVIWWIHEAEYVDKLFAKRFPEIPAILAAADNVYTVSNYAKNSMSKYNKNISILKYGLTDTYELPDKLKETEEKNKVIFSILGSIEQRKAHDILIKAIISLPEEYFNKCHFNIVGKCVDNFINTLKSISANCNCISWFDFIPNVAQSKLFKDTDVLVCISRDDPEPIVVSEAMMNAKACLISENVGQKDLITEGVNGFIVETDNVEALKNKIIKIIDSQDQLSQIGQNARQIYLENYKLDVFENNLLKIIEKTLEKDKKQTQSIEDSFIDKNIKIINDLKLNYSPEEKKICVAYLAYYNPQIDYGINMVENFINTYKNNSAGIEHELVIIAKNWSVTEDFDKLCSIAKENNAKIIYLPDDGFDIGAYFRASNILSSEYVVFLGSNIEISSPNWLKYMYNTFESDESIKLVGAMGSYEKGKSGLFPNPHIRTCCFMIENKLFVEYASKQKFPQTKVDTWRLEHCKESISNYITSNGFNMAVVNSDGEIFYSDKWQQSQTYINNDNAKGLLSDKWARRFLTAGDEVRPFIEISAWGKNILEFPVNFINEYSDDINIFIPYSDRFGIRSSKIFHPVFIGEINKGLTTDALQDNVGINISDKFDYYGELTGYFWIWKNLLPEYKQKYIGFCQNCRALDFDINSKSKQVFAPIFIDSYKDILSCYSSKKIMNCIEGYDIILPDKSSYPVNIIDQYLLNHKKEDFDLAIIAILQNYPDYFEAVKEVLASHSMYLLGNFVMKTELINDFLEWMFNLLQIVEKNINKATYGNYSDIVSSKFMSERLFNFWLVHNIKLRDLKVKTTSSYSIYYDINEYNKVAKTDDRNTCMLKG